MRIICLTFAILASTLAHAQSASELPTTPLPDPDLPPPPPSATAPVEAPAPAPASEESEPDDSEAEDEGEEAQSRGSLWAPLFAGGAACVALDVVGCGFSSVGCLLSQVSPSGGGNCVEDCVIGIVTAGVVLLGVLAATVGLFLLGPLAALVVTAAATIASAIAGRAFWGAGLGGLPGIALGAGGIITAALALTQMDIGSSGGLQPGIFSGDPRSNLALAGLGMAALAGVVALSGALAGDALFTSFLEEEKPLKRRDSSRQAPRDEMPLALAAARTPRMPY